MWSSELSPLSSDAAGETYLPISAGTEAETRLTTEALIVMMAGKSKYYIAECHMSSTITSHHDTDYYLQQKPRDKAQELNEEAEATSELEKFDIQMHQEIKLKSWMKMKMNTFFLVRIVYTWWHLVSNHYLENQLNHHLWWKIEVDWRSASLWRGPVTYEACLKWSENSWEDMMRNIKLATQWSTPAQWWWCYNYWITPPAAPLWIVETMHNLIRSVNTS